MMEVIMVVTSVVENGSKLLAQAAIGSTVHTAIGDIPTDAGAFVSRVVELAVAFGGVAAIGLIAAGGFTILTSTGNPEKLNSGRDMITNALIGLALIVLSVFLLELLGWDILQLETWTGVKFNSWT